MPRHLTTFSAHTYLYKDDNLLKKTQQHIDMLKGHIKMFEWLIEGNDLDMSVEDAIKSGILRV